MATRLVLELEAAGAAGIVLARSCACPCTARRAEPLQDDDNELGIPLAPAVIVDDDVATTLTAAAGTSRLLALQNPPVAARSGVSWRDVSQRIRRSALLLNSAPPEATAARLQRLALNVQRLGEVLRVRAAAAVQSAPGTCPCEEWGRAADSAYRIAGLLLREHPFEHARSSNGGGGNGGGDGGGLRDNATIYDGRIDTDGTDDGGVLLVRAPLAGLSNMLLGSLVGVLLGARWRLQPVLPLVYRQLFGAHLRRDLGSACELYWDWCAGGTFVRRARACGFGVSTSLPMPGRSGVECTHVWTKALRSATALAGANGGNADGDPPLDFDLQCLPPEPAARAYLKASVDGEVAARALLFTLPELPQRLTCATRFALAHAKNVLQLPPSAAFAAFSVALELAGEAVTVWLLPGTQFDDHRVLRAIAAGDHDDEGRLVDGAVRDDGDLAQQFRFVGLVRNTRGVAAAADSLCAAYDLEDDIQDDSLDSGLGLWAEYTSSAAAAAGAKTTTTDSGAADATGAGEKTGEGNTERQAEAKAKTETDAEAWSEGERVAAELAALATAPWRAWGIEREDAARALALEPECVLVQVISGRVWVVDNGPRRRADQHRWWLARRRAAAVRMACDVVQHARADAAMPDVEFVFCPMDGPACSLATARAGHAPPSEMTGEEGEEPVPGVPLQFDGNQSSFGALPVLAPVACAHSFSIPMPLMYRRYLDVDESFFRGCSAASDDAHAQPGPKAGASAGCSNSSGDAHAGGWDALRRQLLRSAALAPWEQRANVDVALFRGTAHARSCWSGREGATLEVQPTVAAVGAPAKGGSGAALGTGGGDGAAAVAAWGAGRGVCGRRLLRRQAHALGLAPGADAAIARKPGVPLTIDARHGFVPLEAQLAYGFTIYAEGHAGWADRARLQLHSGSVLLMQEGPCREWYTLAMEPWAHYIPLEYHFGNLGAVARWAGRGVPGTGARGARRARRLAALRRRSAAFARALLSPRAIRRYADAALRGLARAQRYALQRHAGAVPAESYLQRRAPDECPTPAPPPARPVARLEREQTGGVAQGQPVQAVQVTQSAVLPELVLAYGAAVAS
eukprot:g358.t1